MSDYEFDLLNADKGGRISPNHSLTHKQLWELGKQIKAKGYSETDIAYILRMTTTEWRDLNVQQRRRHQYEIGKKFREMYEDGKSNTEIAEALGINESAVRRILVHLAKGNIWYPGPYEGRINDADFQQVVGDLSLMQIGVLVQKRAKEDGEWTIEQGLVGSMGEHEDKMRRMMAWVSDTTNIAQCIAHILHEKHEYHRTVDWVCRELANASKHAVGRTSSDGTKTEICPDCGGTGFQEGETSGARCTGCEGSGHIDKEQ